MGVYAVEIRGRVIAVFDAPSTREAEHYVHDEGGLAWDWSVLESEGKVICVEGEEITVREAKLLEYNQWQTSRNAAIESGEHDPDREGLIHLVYLIPVRDPTTDDIYDEWEGSDPK